MTQELTKKWRAKMHREKRCVNCGLANLRYPRLECNECFEKRRRLATAHDEQLKLECFEAYGGAVCICCGERILAFLTLDHVENNGCDEVVSGRKLYAKLRKLNYPKGFRVLCFNCNSGRALCSGVCPHNGGSPWLKLA
jgi:hypothetical protein